MSACGMCMFQKSASRIPQSVLHPGPHIEFAVNPIMKPDGKLSYRKKSLW
jgi:hypothetical protein